MRDEPADLPPYELPRVAALILEVVEQIPAGTVLTYGDVAELVGEGGPRQVGTVLARYGSDVPWWRVLRADGTPAPALRDRAFAAYAREGTPVRDARRVDLALARWDGTPLAAPRTGDHSTPRPADLIADAGLPRGSVQPTVGAS